MADNDPRPRHQPVQPSTSGRLFDEANHHVWALEADSRRWVYLPHGHADRPTDTRDPDSPTWKQRARRGELICPFPGCQVAFTTARAGQRRHCFVHPAGESAHSDATSRETRWHLAAKNALAVWAQARYPRAEVTVDSVRLQMPSGWRQPDVLVEMPDRQKIALECQYSGLSAAAWRDRHRFYQEMSVIDVWLFAPIGGHHLAKCTDGGRWPGSIRLMPLQQAMLRDGVIPLWFQPSWGLVGTPESRRRPRLEIPGLAWNRRPQAERAYRLPPAATFTDCVVREDPLDNCRLDLRRGVLLTPTRRDQMSDEVACRQEADRAATALREAKAQPAATPPPMPKPAPKPAPKPVASPAAPAARPAPHPVTRDGVVLLQPSYTTPGYAAGSPYGPGRQRTVSADRATSSPPSPPPSSSPAPSPPVSSPSSWWARLRHRFRRR